MPRNFQEQVSTQAQSALDHEQWFERQVAKHEAASQQNPAAYRRKVIRFSKLMPAFVFGMILLTFGLFATMLVAVSRGGGSYHALGFSGLFLFAMLRSVFFKFPPPEGISISREHAPRLWALVEGVTKATGAPLPTEILIDMDLNAAAAQRRVWGIFGPVKNSLILGFPLMASYSKDEFDFVVAHEFGHFAGEHGANAGRIYWQYQAMENLRQSTQSGVGGIIFGKFFQWYFPRFEALSFVLRRQQEYEADAAAARLSGAHHVRGLLRLPVAAVRLDECYESWTTLITQGQPRPDSQTMDMVAKLAIPAQQDKERSALRAYLSAPTTYNDSHPSYQDRARALGVAAEDLEGSLEYTRQPVPQTAFAAYLSSCLDRITPGFDEVYLLHWEMAQDRTREAEHRIKELEGKDLSLDERVELVMTKLGSRMLAEPEALGQIQELVVRNPGHALAHLALGRLLADRDAPDGETHLRKAMELNIDLTEAAVEAISLLRARLGRHDHDDLKQMAYTEHARQSLIADEAVDVGLDTALVPHELSETELQIVREVTSKYPLRGAYVFGKRLSNGKVMNYLFILPKGIAVSQTTGVKLLEKMEFENAELPDLISFAAVQKFGAWEKKLRAIPGAQVVPSPPSRVS